MAKQVYRVAQIRSMESKPIASESAANSNAA